MTTVSVVINTFNRADSLRTTLAALTRLDYPNYEIVVVNGPSTDHTAAVIAEFGHAIKVGLCPVRNLSRSRNIGVRLSAGELVAFIDDDAVPDPGWLDGIVPVFRADEVGAAGGPVFDYTGAQLQAHYLVCDRFGAAEKRFDRDPSPLLNMPDGRLFCTTIGTNSMFRRRALAEIGGFDEEYDYFLDETDVCVRLVDAGWTVRYADTGFVYHRYLPSHIRTDTRVLSDYDSVLKNKAYFAMRHAARLLGQAAVQEALNDFVGGVRTTLAWAVGDGHLRHDAADAFEGAFDERIRLGFARAASPVVSSLDVHHAAAELPWRPYRGAWATGPRGAWATGPRRLHICYVSQDYPPGIVAGIARMTLSLATGLAAMGHVVRVVTRGPVHTVDFEEGVWVHRVPDVEASAPPGDLDDLPARIWGRSVAVLRELQRIDGMRPIDLVQAPNWDCEGLATLLEQRWQFVLGIYTPMTAALRHNPVWRNDQATMRAVIEPIIAGERLGYQQAPAVLACGNSILQEVEADYGVRFAGRRIGLVPHGLPDQGCPPPPAPSKPTVDILFVGRLEARKGADVLLAAVPDLFRDLPEVRLLLAGDDTLPAEDGRTLRDAFLAAPQTAPYRDRVLFHGVVDDATLNDLYRQCDIVAVPSRFESFGLPLIEGMMRGKPVVGCHVGGMPEIVVAPGSGSPEMENGLLVVPGDAGALAGALRHLAVSASTRRRLGANGRAAFVARYSLARMIEEAAEFYQALVAS